MSLALLRKVGEKIMIGDNIVIEIMMAEYGRCRLAISAPKDIRVDREEIRERIEREGFDPSRGGPKSG